ncbi:MAG TPA: hypothetical protein VLJ68_12120 [Chitinophagaceae bacterium]|nr:hypothetical protein [Chitinophagaceae bacterium]
MQDIQHTYAPAHLVWGTKKSLLLRFIAWCKTQEENRLLWLAAIIMIHGSVLTPLTMLIIIASGTSVLFLALAIAAMGASLMVNLAAMPTKITIPVFVVSVAIDLVVISACLAKGLSLAGF